ncbi:MAG TPA: hypothetical protein VEZ88_13045 [Steroidobacteraceae bacterium]|nr:hypothetical protein [Steroidobacteraceae bacterium]
MNAYIARHKLHPVIDHVFTFDQYEEARAHLKSGNFGTRESHRGRPHGQATARKELH